MKIEYPPGVRAVASRFGADVGTHADFSRFGFDIQTGGQIKVDSSGVHTTATGKTYSAPVASQPAPVGTAAVGTQPTPRAAFGPPAFTMQRVAPVRTRQVLALPIGTDPHTALAVADKLLADPRIVNGKDVVTNTIALAQVPHDKISVEDHSAVQRGAAVIDAAQQIREQTGAVSGQPAIPVQTPDQQAAVDAAMQNAYTLTDDDIAAVTQAAPSHVKLWKRFFDWIASWAS